MASKELTQYDERWAEQAEKYASAEQSGGSFFSVKGGILKLGDEEFPGNQMVVCILDIVQERTFYAGKYNPEAERNQPPICYAFRRMDEAEEEMAPHPSMQNDLSYFVPQNETCKGCPNDEWGSADTGRGKACNDRRRMALLPAGFYTAKRGSRDFDLTILDDPAFYRTADIAFLKLPVMSVKEYGRYVAKIASEHRRPPYAVITRIYVEPDPKSQFRVKFEMLDLIPAELAEIIEARHIEAERGIIFGYPPPSGEAAGNGKGAVRR